MNTYITLSCLLALFAACHGTGLYSGIGGHGYGLGYGYGAVLAPAAVSTANLVRAAPIPVIRTAAVAPIAPVAPVITTPVIRTVAVAAPVSYGIGYGLGGYGLGGYGLGGYGLGGYGAYGGYGGWRAGGYGLGLGGWGYGRAH